TVPQTEIPLHLLCGQHPRLPGAQAVRQALPPGPEDLQVQLSCVMGVSVMKNLLAGGFLFVGGAVLLTADGAVSPVISGAGGVCTMLGVGILLYFLFSNNGKYE